MRIAVLLCGLLGAYDLQSSRLAADDFKPLTILFVGDVMLDGGPGHLINNGVDPFSNCASVLESADITVGNLECVLGRGGQQLNKAYVFRGASDSPRYLKRYFDVLSLANNHSLDFGPEGLVVMMKLLDDARIPYFGAGLNLSSARKPRVIEKAGYRIGFLGYNEFRAENYAATDSLAGNCPFQPDMILEDIKLAKAEHRCDFVLPFLHWGEEMEQQPRPDQVDFARRMIEAGASAVIGTHPHVVQSIDWYRQAPVVYSLGNFVFDYFPVDPLKWTGWMVELKFQRDKPIELKRHIVELDLIGVPQWVGSDSILPPNSR